MAACAADLGPDLHPGVPGHRRPGDPPRNVAWKLSAKRDRLVTYIEKANDTISRGVAVRARTFGQCIDAVRAMDVEWADGPVAGARVLETS